MADSIVPQSKNAAEAVEYFCGGAMRWSVIHEVLDRLAAASKAARQIDARLKVDGVHAPDYRSPTLRLAGTIRGIYKFLDQAYGNAKYVHDVRYPDRPSPSAAAGAAEFVYAPPSAGGGSFALRIRDDSMVNSGEGFNFPPDSTIVVDPSADAIPGEHVIVKLSTAAEPVFRMLESDGQQKFLRALNPRYPTTAMPDDARIIGVVISVQYETWRRPAREPAKVAA